MDWPTPQEYNEAIQNPHVCFSDEELQAGTVALNKLGLPQAVTGSFASVYKITTGGKNYAVRCFLHDIPDQQVRYERLSSAILTDKLECTVDFKFIADGIKLGKRSFPIVKMTWLVGQTLDTYVKNNLQNKLAIADLHWRFKAMLEALKNEGFAHGDLQHGNIIVTEQGLRLVDYDGMFIPALTGFKSNELGHRNFQHPDRSPDDFGQFLDNFSAWVIHTALTCLIEDSTIYERFNSGEGLLFRREDFINPDKSELFYFLETHESRIVRRTSAMFRTVLTCRPHNVPWLCDVPEAAEHPLVAAAKVRHARMQAQKAEQERLAAQVAEWAQSAALADKEREAERLRREKEERERREREAAERQLREHEKPAWLDQDTASVLVQKWQPSTGIAGAGWEAAIATASAPAANAPVPTIPAVEYAASIKVGGDHLHVTLRDWAFETDADRPHNFGTKNAVFRYTSVGGERALKLFCQPIDSGEARLKGIERAVASLPKRVAKYFAPVTSIEQAVLTLGQWCPGLDMPWLEGETVAHALKHSKPDFDYTLLTRFRRAMTAMSAAHIAHGNLDLTNILVQDDDIAFVDYDNLCSESLLASNAKRAYRAANEFQHPRATGLEYDLAIDNFAAWVIDTCLLLWSVDHALWRFFADRNGTSVFTPKDLANPGASDVITKLRKHNAPELKARGDALVSLLSMKAHNIPPLSADGMFLP